MKAMRRGTAMILFFLVMGTAYVCPLTADEMSAEEGETLAFLQRAYQGEIDARMRYEAFASKAHQEGYRQEARLFEAAARAERAHAESHAGAIKAMGAEPVAQIHTPIVGSTRQNMEAALAGEKEELDILYPKFMAKAEDEGEAEAARSFLLAMSVEAEHAELFGRMKEWSEEGRPIYVCPICGHTALIKQGLECPVCASPTADFRKFD